MIRQDDPADIVDGGAHRCQLDQDIPAVPAFLHHLLDGFQVTGRAGKPIENVFRFSVLMNMTHNKTSISPLGGYGDHNTMILFMQPVIKELFTFCLNGRMA